MALITCPECGKQVSDKASACPNCGYPIQPSASAEQPESTVEVQSKKMENLYERARKSLEVDDLEHAAEYFKQILDENPKDWEAYFYSYLGEFPTFTNSQAGTVASKLGKSIPPAYDMAIDGADGAEATARVKLITEKTSEKLLHIAATGAALLQKYQGGNILTPTGKVNSDLYNQLRPMAALTILNCILAYEPIEDKLGEIIAGDNAVDKEEAKQALLAARKARYLIADMQFEPSSGVTERLVKADHIVQLAERVHELDPSFEVPSMESKTNSGGNSGGCYVATAVYGSYDCPEVWTLRRYRDDTLAETWYGRAFIHTYYAVSPTLVKLFGDTAWFKNFWKPRLDQMVQHLNDKGISDQPYCDHDWK